MRNRICVALAIASVAMAGCGVEERRPVGGEGGAGGEAGQGGTGAAGGGGEAGQGGSGGAAGSGGSDDPSCTPVEFADEFGPVPKRKLDVLWVIGNSKAMAPFVDRLASNLAGALAQLEMARVDYRLAVTTTGLDEGPECDGPVRGGEDGRFVPVDGSRPRILEPTTPDVAASWLQNIMVGACHESSHPLEAAYRALSGPLAEFEKDPRHDTDWKDGNAGFLRPNAPLSIVIVTPKGDVAEPDRFPVEYLDLLREAKQTSMPVALSAVTGPRLQGLPADCLAEGGDTLISLTEDTRGIALDICSLSADGSEWYAFPPRAFERFPPGYFLRRTPTDRNEDGVVDELDLLVTVDGKKVAARTSDGRPVWTFDGRTNAIDFLPLYLPSPESIIRVTYFACPPR